MPLMPRPLPCDGLRPPMARDIAPPRRAALALAALWLAATSATAAAPTDAAPATPSAPEPKVERLLHQDGHTRIEELRIGGQTRTIDVRTRSGVPGYEVRPIDPGVSDDRSGAGVRRWRVLAF
ncbi:hypothetical protein Tther_01764 [Tepidimonas thermarum]|uniref:DUF2782 domain-containing protein n=1 Tax=Tepidimonas thermarum TaxID=335431 RepID=A0A554WZF6_9BURK|nr:hypothetical protein [Tepidimonas thermarum]TSE28963.1 hypothetical protein Tther_01764 [Tepidimonas thermarum]